MTTLPEPPPAAAPLEGIDVSHHQGRVAWSEVRGIEFVFLKATEGAHFTDPCFAANWGAAAAQGLLRGAYHFYRPAQDPAAQAAHFLAVMGRLGAGDLPPALDLEATAEPGEWEQPPAERLARLQQWLTAVEQGCGRRPFIYVAPVFWRDVLGAPASFGAYPLWHAEYGVERPHVPTAWLTWTLWQFSQTGTVPGVTGRVDRNRFQGGRSDLERLATGASGAAIDPSRFGPRQ